MSTSTNDERTQCAPLAVRRGNSRVTSVWLSPSIPSTSEESAPQSAGLWVEKHPQLYARVRATIPVTVGSTLRIF